MISTYISLLLLCGFMLLYYNTTHLNNRKLIRKISYPAKTQAVKQSLSARISINSFSFFKDVIGNIAPALKNIK